MEDYALQRPVTRSCRLTNRTFAPGETFYAVLVEEKGHYVLYDYSIEAWTGPPAGAVGHWMTKMPLRKDGVRKKMAVNDILLAVFDNLLGDTRQQDKLYILSLLMIRRQIFRLDSESVSTLDTSLLSVYHPRRDESYRIPAVVPDAARQAEIQDELARLLTGEPEMPELTSDDLPMPEVIEIDDFEH